MSQPAARGGLTGAITGAFGGALAAAPTGNPYLIAGGAGLGGFAGGFGGSWRPLRCVANEVDDLSGNAEAASRSASGNLCPNLCVCYAQSSSIALLGERNTLWSAGRASVRSAKFRSAVWFRTRPRAAKRIAGKRFCGGGVVPRTMPPTPLRAAGHTVSGRLTKRSVYCR